MLHITNWTIEFASNNQGKLFTSSLKITCRTVGLMEDRHERLKEQRSIRL